MKKLKIAVDARTLGSRPSGVGMYLNDFLEQLITYDEFEWVLFTDVKESEYIKRSGRLIRLFLLISVEALRHLSQYTICFLFSM